MLIYKLLGDQAQQELARACVTDVSAVCSLTHALSFRFPQEAGACHMVRAPLSRVVTAAHGLSLLAPSGMNTASEWKDVMIESLKGMVILAILERLYVTRAASWFEDHIGVCGMLGWQRCFRAG
jgi:hypothetical protein